MDAEKRKALEAAGVRFGDAADFLELTAAERHLIEVRLTVGRAVRTLREVAELTQKDLASKVRTTQARVSKIESGDPSVSLEAMVRSLHVLGGRIEVITPPGRGPAPQPPPLRRVRTT